MFKQQKGMLTSHELGFYRSFAHQEKPNIFKKAKKASKVVENRSYLYLFLEKIATNGEVSITQKELADKLGVTVQTIRRGQHKLETCGLIEKVKEADPTARQPITYRLRKGM